MKPLVSIIVPVYNVEKYIDGCIKSILTQTYKNLQIILVDDESPDNSGKICEEFAKTDNRITVIHKLNGGLSSARNAGLDIADGDYIMFVDSDDYLADNTVETLISVNEKYDADIVQFNFFETDKEYYKFSADLPQNILFTQNKKEMFENLYKIGGSAVSACTKFYKSSLFKSFRFKEGILYEDEHMCTHLLPDVNSILYVDGNFYNYVKREGSIINSSFSPKKLDSIWVSYDRINQLKNLNYNDLVQTENNKLFMNLTSLWCEAKKINDLKSLKYITGELKNFLKKEKITLGSKFKLLYYLCKIDVSLLLFYYIYKKIAKQV